MQGTYLNKLTQWKFNHEVGCPQAESSLIMVPIPFEPKFNCPKLQDEILHDLSIGLLKLHECSRTNSIPSVIFDKLTGHRAAGSSCHDTMFYSCRTRESDFVFLASADTLDLLTSQCISVNHTSSAFPLPP